MTVVEEFSLFQRIAGSLRSDIEEGLTQKALGKLEILEGELSVLRKGHLEESTPVEDVVPMEESAPADDIIDVDFSEPVENI